MDFFRFAIIQNRRKTIFEYINFREFLKEEYNFKKKNQGMSLRDFARAAGFSTHTFLSNVIAGKRSLSLDSAGKMARGLGLSPRERDFFELLVRFDLADNVDERNEVFAKISHSLPKGATKKISSEFYEIFRNPHTITIRELVVLPGFKEDFEWIGRKLRPQITAKQAEKALSALVSAGFLVRDDHGRLIQQTADLSTGPEVRSLAVSLYHKKILEFAEQSIDSTPARNRDLSALTLNVSRSEFEFIKKRIVEMRKEIMDFLKDKRDLKEATGQNEKERALYYLSVQFFNATEISWDEPD